MGVAGYCGVLSFTASQKTKGNDEAAPVCYDCFRNNYTHCTRCGQTISHDDCWYPLDSDDPYCRDCFDSIENAPIHDYFFKPRPIFYGDGPRYFGVELEIDGAGEDDSNASALLRIANQEYPLAYCKHDGSLDDGSAIPASIWQMWTPLSSAYSGAH